MSEPWSEVADSVRRHIVKFKTPNGIGSGFYLRNVGDNVAIATAYHVIKGHIGGISRVDCESHTGKTANLELRNRNVCFIGASDIAVISIPRSLIDVPESPISPLAPGKAPKKGDTLFWMSFPGVVPKTLCAFWGRVSSFVNGVYYIDANDAESIPCAPAIEFHGPQAHALRRGDELQEVSGKQISGSNSGGPVLMLDGDTKKPRIVGVGKAYEGPFCLAHNVSDLHDLVSLLTVSSQ